MQYEKESIIIIDMETIIKNVNEQDLDEEILLEAGEILRGGGLVAFPTETVYGLGANALDEEAAKKTYEAKGRPSDNPLIVHIADISNLSPIVKEVTEETMALAKKFWPGPLTMILEKSDMVPLGTTGGLTTVAVRMPSNKIALELIRAAGGYVSAPSANSSGRPSPTEAHHVYEDLHGKIEMILDGGPVEIGVESTIVDMTVSPPMILRPGAITKEMLEEVLGEVAIDHTLLSADSQEAPKAPGMKYRHYAPKAQMMIVEGELADIVKAIRQLTYSRMRKGQRVGVIASAETAKLYTYGVIKTIGARENENSVARNLYRILREFDEEEVDVIYCETFDEAGIGQAIMNRLMKAAGHQTLMASVITCLQQYRQIIFVSESDNCRGPMAAELLRQKDLLQEYIIKSRGLIVLFPEPANQKAEAIMKSKQMTLEEHQTVLLEEEEVNEDTLLLAMESTQKEKLLEMFPGVCDIYTLPEYVGEIKEVASPYGEPLTKYGETYEYLEFLIDKLTIRLNEEAEKNDRNWL